MYNRLYPPPSPNRDHNQRSYLTYVSEEALADLEGFIFTFCDVCQEISTMELVNLLYVTEYDSSLAS